MDGRLPGQPISHISAIGPDQVPSWADLRNIDRLCARCQTIDWEPVKLYFIVADGYDFFPEIPLYSTYPTLGQLREAAHEGCHLCTLIFACLLIARYQSSIDDTAEALCAFISSLDDDALIKVDVEVTPGPEYTVWLKVDLCHDFIEHSVHFDILIYSLPITSGMLQRSHTIQFSSPAEDIARFWLEDCCANHKLCMSETPMLPKRVIDVASGPEPFLILSHFKYARYAALSYCFGKNPVLTTTENTLLERQAGIPMTMLPTTVRDAVTWTRELGLQYLWVDSLCILQDSLTDWEVELSTMADIYRYATVTIAATAASHAWSGCAPERNKLQLAPCRPVPGIIIEWITPRKQWIFHRGPLEKRGWTYQELQLSWRVLRCGKQLAWQCRTHERLESDPTDSERRIIGQITGGRAFDAIERMDIDEAFRAWYGMVVKFKQRNLTYAADILPAFSGMARHFAGRVWHTLTRTNTKPNLMPAQSISPDKGHPNYLCGLWEDDLLQGILWSSYNPCLPIPYRGPSWSWVHYESSCGYSQLGLRDHNFYAEVLEVSVTVPGLNPYGRVSSGKLTMLGPVAPLPSTAYGDDSGIHLDEALRLALHWDLLGPPQLGSICFRMQGSTCLILAPESRCHRGTYRRVGLIGVGDDPNSPKVEWFRQLDWQSRIVTII